MDKIQFCAGGHSHSGVSIRKITVKELSGCVQNREGNEHKVGNVGLYFWLIKNGIYISLFSLKTEHIGNK